MREEQLEKGRRSMAGSFRRNSQRKLILFIQSFLSLSLSKDSLFGLGKGSLQEISSVKATKVQNFGKPGKGAFFRVSREEEETKRKERKIERKIERKEYVNTPY